MPTSEKGGWGVTIRTLFFLFFCLFRKNGLLNDKNSKRNANGMQTEGSFLSFSSFFPLFFLFIFLSFLSSFFPLFFSFSLLSSPCLLLLVSFVCICLFFSSFVRMYCAPSHFLSELLWNGEGKKYYGYC